MTTLVRMSSVICVSGDDNEPISSRDPVDQADIECRSTVYLHRAVSAHVSLALHKSCAQQPGDRDCLLADELSLSLSQLR